jgi:hypothetical protein
MRFQVQRIAVGQQVCKTSGDRFAVFGVDSDIEFHAFLLNE